MIHRPDIDGLRAVAVIPVVLYHMGVPAFGGGFTGVDVFFVISGFLITSIIAEDIERPDRRFSLITFYERRIRRIFPALFTVLFVTSALAAVVLLPRDLADYSKSLVATAAFASNIHLYRQAGYFDAEAHTKPLLHTWSLAVEEQFYLVFPLLLLLLYRWLGQRARVRVVLATLALGSLALSIWQVRVRPDAAFYLLPARAWELLLGSLLALGAVPAFPRAWHADAAAVLGIALLGVGFVAYSGATPFPGAAALAPCLGTALLIHAGGATTVNRLLARGPLVFVGLLSYSLYLWHWALLSLARHWSLEPLTMPRIAAVVGISLLAAAASWRFIERPLRARRAPGAGAPAASASGGAPDSAPDRAPARVPWRVLGWGGAVSAATIGLGLAGALSEGWPERMSPGVLALDAAQQDFNPERARCHATDRRDVPYRDTCRFGAPATAPRYALWGDSHAAELSVALGELAARSGESVRMVTYSACPPGSVHGGARGGTGGCAAHERATLDAIRADTALAVVFLVARYSQAREEQGDGFFTELGRVARALADAGKSVALVYPAPEYGFSVPTQLARAAHRGDDIATLGLPRGAFDAQRARIVRALDAIRTDARIAMVDPSRRLCDPVRCRIFAAGHALYFDDDHLSLSGARYVAPVFAPYFASGGSSAAADGAQSGARQGTGTRVALY